MSSDDRRTNSPQSVTRVIRILEALAVSAKPLGLADLSRVLETPKSSLAALLRGLAEAEFVIASEGAFRLGPGAFGLGGALIEARRRYSSSDLVRDGMRRLAEKSGETVLFAVADADGASMTYVDVLESRNSVRFAVEVGDRRPLYCTAGGRALLAARDEEEIAAYLRTLKMHPLTESTETDGKRLANILAEVRAAGVAQTIDQTAEGVSGTAAVVRHSGGKVLGALIVAAPSGRLRDRDGLARLVREEAESISRNLGYRLSH